MKGDDMTVGDECIMRRRVIGGLQCEGGKERAKM